MEEGFLQRLFPRGEGDGHYRTAAYSKLYNVLCPPQPNLREIAQGFALSKEKSKANVWESFLDAPSDLAGGSSGKEGNSLDKASEGDDQGSSQHAPVRTVRGFEATSSSNSATSSGDQLERKKETDQSELSIGFFRRKKLRVVLFAARLHADKAGNKRDVMEFQVDADRTLTASMLTQVILGKISAKDYKVDFTGYEVRFPDRDDDGLKPEEATADTTLPPLGFQQPVSQLNSNMFVITERPVNNKALAMKTRVSINSFERDRSRFPTLSQLSPEELDEYFKKNTPKDSKNPITCIVKLAISPLCTKKLVGSIGRSLQSFADCIPQSVVLRADSGMTVEDLTKFFLGSLCKGYEEHWKDWMIRKTKVSVFDTVDERCSFWMHQGNNPLGEVLDTDAKVTDVAAWQTIVLLPRTSKYALEKKASESQRGKSEQPKVTYLFTEQTASMYVEYNVVKFNRYGKKQERILGIDREQIYNLLPRLQLDEDSMDMELTASDLIEAKGASADLSAKSLAAKVSRGLLQSTTSETKKRVRQVNQVKSCEVSGDNKAVGCLRYKDGSTYNFEFENEDLCAEAVARINYLVKLCTESL
ncbi:hypothetical protein HOP50_04g31620 [Chloropicon primus]|uniref:Sin1 middle CRIM domain-containing protein n=1 Tax=Chloropicon primus TaxID=1764295 RepID=A0A5B8MMV8_9CHLO|nr:hypothetical protein A3770_04p31580 [Chloropicon primus]UPQ99852.1 hypothetical protein HOP50_04g31620 [Chloropicon primus]|eukprot:QDZ20640.1 hypothetical protein A3770_04p31580 [Chloropicon primus]